MRSATARPDPRAEDMLRHRILTVKPGTFGRHHCTEAPVKGACTYIDVRFAGMRRAAEFVSSPYPPESAAEHRRAWLTWC